MPKPKREFKAEEVKKTLDQLMAMHECAVDREDDEDTAALAIAITATRILLGDGTHDAVVVGWKEG